MALLTQSRLAQMLAREVDSSHLLIAKNLVLGTSKEALPRILGMDEKEIQEILEHPDYKDVFTLVAADHNEKLMNTQVSIDEVESRAWQLTAKHLESETDPVRLAQVATAANRATRRLAVNTEVLDPGAAESVVRIRLTERVVKSLREEKIARKGEDNLGSGQMTNPTFDQLQEFLGQRKAEIKTIETTRQVEAESKSPLMVSKLLEALRGA